MIRSIRGLKCMFITSIVIFHISKFLRKITSNSIVVLDFVNTVKEQLYKKLLEEEIIYQLLSTIDWATYLKFLSLVSSIFLKSRVEACPYRNQKMSESAYSSSA